MVEPMYLPTYVPGDAILVQLDSCKTPLFLVDFKSTLIPGKGREYDAPLLPLHSLCCIAPLSALACTSFSIGRSCSSPPPPPPAGAVIGQCDCKMLFKV